MRLRGELAERNFVTYPPTGTRVTDDELPEDGPIPYGHRFSYDISVPVDLEVEFEIVFTDDCEVDPDEI